MVRKIIELEIKKMRKKYRASKLLYFAIIFVIFSALLSADKGINSDSQIYTISGDTFYDKNFLYIDTNKLMNDPKYLEGLKSGYIDLYLNGTLVIVANSEKAFSAADDLRKTLKKRFSQILYNKYGDTAFPVVIIPKYVKRNISFKEFGELQLTTIKTTKTEISEIIENDKKPTDLIDEKEVQRVIRKLHGYSDNNYDYISKIKNVFKIKGENRTKVELPETFYPQNLASNMLIGFIFLIPSYFIMQVYSSSILKDRIKKRFEILIATPIKNYEIIIGTLTPYLTLSTTIVVITSVIIGINFLHTLYYIFPPLLFLFTLQGFIAMISRSYREATFLLVMANLLITSYLFLPAIFSGLPLSKISPITFLLQEIRGEEINIQDVLFSNFQFIVMAIFLLYLSSNSLDSEMLSSNKPILPKTIDILSKVVNSEFKAFIFAFSTVPFALIAELFILFILSSLPIPVLTTLLLSIFIFAMIEEFLKSSIIYSATKTNFIKNPKIAIIVALGFFVSEKLLLIISNQYLTIFMTSLLILPLLLHMTSSLVFYILSVKGVGMKNIYLAYFSAVTIHFAYNAVILL